MHLNEIKVNIDQPVFEWHRLLEAASANDFIVIEKDRDKMIWFITNYTQFLIRSGNVEVATLYGRLIPDYKSFVYQANLALPVGYELGTNPHALFDLLLNFETEPENRFIIWNDAGYLYHLNEEDFRDIFEQLIVSAYCNRNGISTIKADGTRYRVNQRNIFIFNEDEFDTIKPLLDREYYITSIDKPFNKRIDFNLVRLADGSTNQ
ncbi:hypothetical protein [Chitinophaga filiformis]|uniref:Uncharacterized protein n=1 Tax=Chitinophaga filiformis TaxID=104663 RepID=A0ABY4I309_CHIFI|nr:hypothetical protein [Chitinophaga filiformis]UPK69131.1 hypothetical protein MYF79_29670 [Chitinophaga filiformis]